MLEIKYLSVVEPGKWTYWIQGKARDVQETENIGRVIVCSLRGLSEEWHRHSLPVLEIRLRQCQFPPAYQYQLNFSEQNNITKWRPELLIPRPTQGHLYQGKFI